MQPDRVEIVVRDHRPGPADVARAHQTRCGQGGQEMRAHHRLRAHEAHRLHQPAHHHRLQLHPQCGPGGVGALGVGGVVDHAPEAGPALHQAEVAPHPQRAHARREVLHGIDVHRGDAPRLGGGDDGFCAAGVASADRGADHHQGTVCRRTSVAGTGTGGEQPGLQRGTSWRRNGGWGRDRPRPPEVPSRPAAQRDGQASDAVQGMEPATDTGTNEHRQRGILVPANGRR